MANITCTVNLEIFVVKIFLYSMVATKISVHESFFTQKFPDLRYVKTNMDVASAMYTCMYMYICAAESV